MYICISIYWFTRIFAIANAAVLLAVIFGEYRSRLKSGSGQRGIEVRGIYYVIYFASTYMHICVYTYAFTQHHKNMRIYSKIFQPIATSSW